MKWYFQLIGLVFAYVATLNFRGENVHFTILYGLAALGVWMDGVAHRIKNLRP